MQRLLSALAQAKMIFECAKMIFECLLSQHYTENMFMGAFVYSVTV